MPLALVLRSTLHLAVAVALTMQLVIELEKFQLFPFEINQN